MVISEELGAESKASMVAPPCFPVAPVTRTLIAAMVLAGKAVSGVSLPNHVRECLTGNIDEIR